MPRRPLTISDGLRPRFGLGPQSMGQRPYEGHSPFLFQRSPARHSHAAHPAAEPCLELPTVRPVENPLFSQSRTKASY